MKKFTDTLCVPTIDLRRSSNRVQQCPDPLPRQTPAHGDTDHPLQLQP